MNVLHREMFNANGKFISTTRVSAQPRVAHTPRRLARSRRSARSTCRGRLSIVVLMQAF